ncbi:MAG: HNH endonuclease [Gemmatimonadetes bacterium]|nr:HNH endonuclease [Gemmatimonadota bacterium]
MEARSRHVPARVRDEVFLRDAFRCTFVAPDGTRCDATRHLQIDHVRPFALGGKHEPENLRLLCGAHNRREAERMGLAK